MATGVDGADKIRRFASIERHINSAQTWSTILAGTYSQSVFPKESEGEQKDPGRTMIAAAASESRDGVSRTGRCRAGVVLRSE